MIRRSGDWVKGRLCSAPLIVKRPQGDRARGRPGDGELLLTHNAPDAVLNEHYVLSVFYTAHAETPAAGAAFAYDRI